MNEIRPQQVTVPQTSIQYESCKEKVMTEPYSIFSGSISKGMSLRASICIKFSQSFAFKYHFERNVKFVNFGAH